MVSGAWRGGRNGEVVARFCLRLEEASERRCFGFSQLECGFLIVRVPTVLIAFSFRCHLLGCFTVFCRERKLTKRSAKTAYY